MDNTEIFFRKIVELDNENYIELRIHDNLGKYNPISRYIQTYEEYLETLRDFKDKRWNIYFGINKRPEKKRKMKDIPQRYLHYFDIEATKNKPPFNNPTYKLQLHRAINFIIQLLKKEFNLDYAAILKTGRGVSLYYKFDPPLDIQYEKKFKEWMKFIVYLKIEEEFKKHELLFDKVKKEFLIKAWDSVFDSSRINGAPLSVHTKYPELPKRKVLKINESNYINDNLKSILDELKTIPKGKRNSLKRQKNLYKITNQTTSNPRNNNFFFTEEFKILSRYQNIPEGNIKSNIIFPLKMFTQEFDRQNFPKLQRELNRLGYEGDHNMPGEEYVYTQNTFRNWCYQNFRWCLQNNFPVKYKFKINKRLQLLNRPKQELVLNIALEMAELKTMDDVIKFIKLFNKETKHINSKQQLVVYWDDLKSFLDNLCSEDLLAFIRINKLFDNLKYVGLKHNI